MYAMMQSVDRSETVKLRDGRPSAATVSEFRRFTALRPLLESSIHCDPR